MRAGTTSVGRLIVGLASVIAAAALLPPPADAVELPFPVVSVRGEATLGPQALSATEFRPTTLRLTSKIVSTDGTPLPQVEILRFRLDPDIRLHVKSKGNCTKFEILDGTGSVSKACRRAIIGSGAAWLQEDSATVRLRLTLFKDGKAGQRSHFLAAARRSTGGPTFVGAGNIVEGGGSRRGESVEVDLAPLEPGVSVLRRTMLKFREAHASGTAAVAVSARCSSGSLATVAEAEFHPSTGSPKGEQITSETVAGCAASK